MQKLENKELSDIDRKVRDAQIQLLYKQSWTGLGGVLIVALTACVVFWQVIPQWKLSLWVGITVLLTLTRACVILAFQRKTPLTAEIDRWATLHVIGVTVSAIMWAIPSIFLWPSEYSVYQLVWPLLILPLCAAGVAIYYIWTSSYVSFLLIAMVPLSLRFFGEGGFLFNILGLLALFFIAVLLRAAIVMHAASVRAFEYGIRNDVLNVELKEVLAQEGQLNTQLQQEIAERKLSEEKLGIRNQDLVRLNEELTITKNNLESSNRNLEEAIANIRQLSGMLPICASCKNIRNDRGYWERLESYLSDHTGVLFSHSICPECAKRLYPDLDIDSEN